jgi:uncharacterized protein
MDQSFTNKLAQESSPYLLQHAHNPVNWFPWGEEALEAAKTANKPILVSIGYAACHWCHVMERESFEDEATAAIMNEHFINIKIDREERPDLDHIYMDAVQAITGSGGWPLNVFLTPDLAPFYGGTYFPPVRAHNRPSWKEVLLGISKAYQEKKEDIQAQASQLTEHLQKSNAFGLATPSSDAIQRFFTHETLQQIAEKLLAAADTNKGGFGAAPKFPQTFSIRYLLRHFHTTKDEASLSQALLSLDKMMLGGIYDHVGGGFARYSVDAEWQVPHFEKMLYDNALIVLVLAEAFQLTQKTIYKEYVVQTLHFIQRELMHTQQGFYSAIDADSEGVEGKFYTYTQAEIDHVLEADAAAFSKLYRVEKEGNWPEGKEEEQPTNILWLRDFLNEDDKKLSDVCIPKLMAYRSQRIRPLTDDKCLLGWNALMNQAFAAGYAITGDEAYKQVAIANFQFLEENYKNNKGRWHHTWKNGVATIPAFLDDLAYLIQACIQLQEITGASSYLLKAKSITEQVMVDFEETTTGFFYYTPVYQTDILLRKKEVYDGATPSGNAVMAQNLFYLSAVFDIPLWEERAKHMLSTMANAIEKYPTSFGVWAGLLQTQIAGYTEIAITGQQAKAHLYPILEAYIPHKILMSNEEETAIFPLLQGKNFTSKGAQFYLCRDKVCKPPFFTVNALLANV